MHCALECIGPLNEKIISYWLEILNALLYLVKLFVSRYFPGSRCHERRKHAVIFFRSIICLFIDLHVKVVSNNFTLYISLFFLFFFLVFPLFITSLLGVGAVLVWRAIWSELILFLRFLPLDAKIFLERSKEFISKTGE